MSYPARAAVPGFRSVSLALLAWLVLLPQCALADLMLFPKRIVFEKKDRAAQVTLVNNGSDPATYRLSLRNRRMSESGALSVIDAPGPDDRFSDAMLRFSPHEVTLAPGASQVVRIMLRKPADLAPGEYRSHLQFDKQPDVNAGNSIETQTAKPASGIGISITMLLGASIPVIVRHGETTAGAALSGLELQGPTNGQPPSLAMMLERSGNRSLFGDLEVMFTPQGGTARSVAKLNGVALYVPTPRRRMDLALKSGDDQPIEKGTLHVTFRERDDAGGTLLAEATRQIP